MEENTRVNIWTTEGRGTEYFHGLMDESMREGGKMESNTERVRISHLVVNLK